MKNILYIGNKLSKTGKTVSSIETLGKFLEAEGYHMTTASSQSNKVLRLLDMLYHVVKHCRKTDYVLIDTYSTSNFYYAFLVSQMCRIFYLKYIPILRGGNLPERLKISYHLSKSIFNKAYTNVVPSAYIQQEFKNQGFNNLICIPNTITLTNYPFIEKLSYKVKLLWVRAFAKIYNPLLAIQVLKALKDKNIDAELCMVGPDKDGSLEEAKTLANTLNLNVRFTGKLSKEEWIKLAADYNIFINTTYFDNMPVSVIEAMALGLPIISTNVGGMPFLITDKKDGILVPSNSVEDFVEAIIHVFKDTHSTHNMVYNARKKAQMYDWEVVKEHWLKLLS